MKKIIALVLILAIATIILTGCSSMPKYEEEKEKKDDKTFMIVEDYISSRVLVDKETNVMYWESCGSYNYGTLTLLVDQDGKPKIWNGGK